VAVRKLSLSLLRAKVGIAQAEGSPQYLHFIADPPSTHLPSAVSAGNE
jgi:hypothetical protein